MRKTAAFVLAVAVVGAPELVTAQGTGLETQLAVIVQSSIGSNYALAGYVVMDSVIGGGPIEGFEEDITDPYATLGGCILFSAEREYPSDPVPDDFDPEANTVFGVFKNGGILWYTDVCRGGFGEQMRIFSTADWNSDGEVDIALVSAEGKTASPDYLWIISWNGVVGRILNDVDSTGQSRILSTRYGFEVLDSDNDGVNEIRAYWMEDGDGSGYMPSIPVSTRPWVTYGWNGSLYGLWQSVRQVPGTEMVPANRLTATVKASVMRGNDGVYSYAYTWTNDARSKQKIAFIGLCDSDSSAAFSAPPPWQVILTGPGVGPEWNCDLNHKGHIRPGQSCAGFEINSRHLPGIVAFYVQGYTDPPDWIEHEEAFTDQALRDNMLNNSVKVHTVGPQIPAGSLDRLGLADTLVSCARQCRAFTWITTQATADKYIGYVSTARTQLQTNDNAGARTTLQSVLHDVDQDSSTTLTSEAYALIRYNTEYLLAHIPEPGMAVKLVSSAGARLTGGSLQYYEGSWKDATSHNDGTFSVNTTLHTVSLRMTYAYGTQTKSNVVVGSDTVVFQTVSAAVCLVNSQSVSIDTGSVQYYAGAWRTFGTTSNGIASKELLPGSYSFRMTYASGSNDKQQDIGSNPTVTFQTAAVSVQLQNSQGALIDQGTVQYYAGAWRTFGTTSSGIATKELLPSTYSFRMTYAFGSTDKQQNIGTNATVVFQTVAATVRLFNSGGSPLDQGTVQYYSGAWRDFGTTANGTVTKELLPRSYSFRMTHAFASIDKTQDLSSSPAVSFSTVLCTVRVKNAQGQPVNNALASYYSGAWRQIGSTVNGEVTKELLPVNLTFRASSGGTSQDKAQNLSTNPVVEFVIP
jgi:hypothetical protein